MAPDTHSQIHTAGIETQSAQVEGKVQLAVLIYPGGGGEVFPLEPETYSTLNDA